MAGAIAAYRSGVEERLRRAERDRAVSAAEAREQRKRRTVQLALAGAVGLFLAVGLGFAWWHDRREAQRERVAEREGFERRAAEERLDHESIFPGIPEGPGKMREPLGGPGSGKR